jgi:hypothetical protein
MLPARSAVGYRPHKLGVDMTESSTGEQFQFWLAHMDDALEKFLGALPPSVRKQLDGEPASLDKLEEWLLSRYPTVADTKPPTEASTLDGASRYVGEIFRRVTYSKWTTENGDLKFAFYGLPILKGGKLFRMPACPLTMVTASIDRRTGQYLSTIVSNFQS